MLSDDAETKPESKKRAREVDADEGIDIDDVDGFAWGDDSDDYDYDAEFTPIVNADDDPLLATVLKRCYGMVVRTVVLHLQCCTFPLRVHVV